ncbi:hypothetical protein CsSME_00009269 [Camellia sinensis var. sinensis]
MGRADGPNPSSEQKWIKSIQSYPSGPAHLYNGLTKGRTEAQRYRAEGTTQRSMETVSVCMCKLPPQLVPDT